VRQQPLRDARVAITLRAGYITAVTTLSTRRSRKRAGRPRVTTLGPPCSPSI